MPYGSYGYTSGHRQGPSYTYGKPSVSSSHSASGYSYGSGSKYSPNYRSTATYESLIPLSNQRSYFRDSPTSGSHRTDSPQSINLDTPSSGHSLHRESSGSSSYKGYDSAYQSQSPKFSSIVEGKDKTLVAPYSSSPQYSVLPSQDCSLTSSKSSDYISEGNSSSSDNCDEYTEACVASLTCMSSFLSTGKGNELLEIFRVTEELDKLKFITLREMRDEI